MHRERTSSDLQVARLVGFCTADFAEVWGGLLAARKLWKRRFFYFHSGVWAVRAQVQDSVIGEAKLG